MIRWLIVTLALIVLAALVAGAWRTRPNPEGFTSDLLINFASEAFGIILAFLLVNTLLDLHHRETASIRLAQTILHDIDQAVWVWLGGKREFGLAESRVLLERVDDTARPARFTETLLINVGGSASNALRTRERVVKTHPALQAGLEFLVPLAGLRDGKPGTTLPPSTIARQLLQSQPQLCKAARIRDIPQSRESDGYDPSERAQRWRHSGE